MARRRPTRLAGGYAATIVWLRWIIVPGWIALALYAALWAPPVHAPRGSDLDGFVPADSPAVAAELASVREFGFPLLARTVLVQRDPDGLSPYTQAQAVLRALALNQQAYTDADPILGALPLLNTAGLFPASSERNTTALTYLFMPPNAGFAQQTRAARGFAERHVEADDAFVGVTGSVPARVEQARIVEESLPFVEVATVAAIVLIVGLNFRSVLAPVVALVTAGIGFVVTLRLAELAGAWLRVSVPAELRPLIVALLLGVATDYVIFFLSGTRHEMRRGLTRLGAARAAAADFGPIVAVAGLTVAAGTASLLAAESSFFRAFGPGMALTVLVALVVSVTLVPALLAILGRTVFWPAPPPAPRAAAPAPRPWEVATDPAADLDEDADIAGPGPTRLVRRVFRGGGVRLLVRRPVAAVVALACTAGLLVAAWPVREMQLGLAFVPSLPASTESRVAARAATAGFAPGILSPTEVLLQAEGLTDRRLELARLGRALESEPGVAGVLGPGDQLAPVEFGVLLARAGDAARYLVVLEDEALGATAIGAVRRLENRLPTLLAEAGLGDVRFGVAGDTALAAGLVASTTDDLGRIATAALLVNLLLLVLFLRALVAPLYLLATSVLALAAALGVTTWVFQDLLGHDGLTFYVPFAAAVLLVALGSDYNIFGVGHIWGEARHRPLREAIVVAVPQTTRAITAAGITLAASFGLLAVVPLRPFRELALVMAVGILLDAVVVRTFLVPTLLALVGRVSGWPGRSLALPAGHAGPVVRGHTDHPGSRS